MKKQSIVILLLACITFTGFGQRKIVNLPDLPGYVTLKCDLHMHTVFSDGNVWPTVRIGEAYRDGLDAIAITDHVEYTPHKDYIPEDHNAAWKITENLAKEFNLILVHGAEITRRMPPGHFNALFIQDANALDVDSVWDAFAAAIKQGAFLFWNHPGWRSQRPDGIPKMFEIHQRLIKDGWLHGIEFFNTDEYYPLVMTYCKQFNLTVLANSDVHNMISDIYSEPDYPNRPMTLVFAKGRTHDALKEALFAGRTLAYFKNTIAGKEEYAKPFFFQCISIAKPFLTTDRNIVFEITNNSDIAYYLVNGPAGAPASITLPANSVTRVSISANFTGKLIYDVKNVITGEDEILKAEISY